jgi:hypothetical protein
VPRPARGGAFVDPRFGSRVLRLTDARAAEAQGIVPDYAKRQAWNSDESLLLLRTGDGAVQLYDGTTYAFKNVLDGVGGEDLFWHPSDPAVVLYNGDNTLYSYNVNTDTRTQVAAFPQYTFANTRGEGNLSRDGRWYAVVGQNYDAGTQQVSWKDLLVCDLTSGQVTARLALPAGQENFDWVSISPLGNYVVVDYASTETGRFQGVEVYDRDFHLRWQKPIGAGHSDLAVEADGSEALIMDRYDADSNSTFIEKFRLADGQETRLLQISELFDVHISCRSEGRPGWCVLSTFDFTGRLADDAASWLPFEDEIFALNLDGSGGVQRIAHHHSRRYSPGTPDSDRSNYWAEPHATVSRRGDHILFGSNWRLDLADPAGVDTYLVEWRR